MELNDWPPRKNFPPPPISDRWQRELIQIAGRTPNGMPHLRLEWGGTCTWTQYTPEIKYLHRRDTEQAGWIIDIRDKDSGNVVRSVRLPLKTDTYQMEQAREHGPTEVAGIPYAVTKVVEIGIPRYWISQYSPPELLGPWGECRDRIKRNVRSDADMGPAPREGFYYLGFHGLWTHDSGRKCCQRARDSKSKCFGYYRPPAELDMMYIAALWKENLEDYRHDWREAPDEATMAKNLGRLVDKHQEVGRREREEMKLRIKDAFRTHKAQFTSQKKRDTWVFTPADKRMPGTIIQP